MHRDVSGARVTYDQGVIVAEQNFPGTDSGVKLFCYSCEALLSSLRERYESGKQAAKYRKKIAP